MLNQCSDKVYLYLIHNLKANSFSVSKLSIMFVGRIFLDIFVSIFDSIFQTWLQQYIQFLMFF